MKVDIGMMQDLALVQVSEWVVMFSVNDNLTVPGFNFSVRGILGDADFRAFDVVGALDLVREFLSGSSVP